MTTWWWVRHGPTHEKCFVGWRDVPADLSDTGQIARLNAYLPEDAIVVSSDLIRAKTTADALTQNRRRLPNTAALREFNFGAWDGLGFDDVTARDPELSRAFWESPGDVIAPQGESWNMAAARAKPFVDRVNSQHPDAHIIAVAHFGIIMTQIQRASGKTAYETLGHSIENLSVTRLEFDQGIWRVHSISILP